MKLYLDSSALVKLVQRETESTDLRAVVTYDQRMHAAAVAIGMVADAPA